METASRFSGPRRVTVAAGVARNKARVPDAGFGCLIELSRPFCAMRAASISGAGGAGWVRTRKRRCGREGSRFGLLSSRERALRLQPRLLFCTLLIGQCDLQNDVRGNATDRAIARNIAFLSLPCCCQIALLVFHHILAATLSQLLTLDNPPVRLLIFSAPASLQYHRCSFSYRKATEPAARRACSTSLPNPCGFHNCCQEVTT
jgi:hypothetical protein